MSLRMYPDGTVSALPFPSRFELRGAATAEPPAIDIGADILNIERLPAAPARITICRQSPKDAGYREIFVSLDGRQLAMLQFGDSYTCEVKPGPHRLRAHNTLFWKTHQIVLRTGEHAKFTAINRTGTISMGLLFMLGAFPVYLTFERELDKAQIPSPKSLGFFYRQAPSRPRSRMTRNSGNSVFTGASLAPPGRFAMAACAGSSAPA